MLTFFIETILQRTLTLPLTWGLFYPSYAGDLIVNDVALRTPEQHAPAILSAEKVVVDPRWGSVFSEVIPISSVRVSNVEAEIDLARPQQVIFCLHNKSCNGSSNFFGLSRARLGEAQIKSKEVNQSASDRLPLKVEVGSFIVDTGVLKVKRGGEQLDFEVVSIMGGPVQVPLDLRDIKLNIDSFLVDEATKRKHPVRSLLIWHAKQRSLTASFVVKDFPIELFTKLFPEFETRLMSKGAAMTSGKLSGEVALSYSPNLGWKLK